MSANDPTADAASLSPRLDAALVALWRRRWQWLGVALAAALLGLGGSYLVKPVYTARTTFLPPQMPQSAAASALTTLGGLAGLAGGAAVRQPIDQYASLLQSNQIADRLIDEFKLMTLYEVEFRADARRQLAQNVRVAVGRKDGFISIEVDDHDPSRAASLANRHVEELRRLTAGLSLSEAQQRRSFFESQITGARKQLETAQRALQDSGFSASALRAEPRAAAEGYASLRAEITAAEVRLQTLRRSLADGTPEVQQQRTLLSALRSQLTRVEQPPSERSDDYVGRYREFKYQESLLELLLRQFEAARVDEAREGVLIQVVDRATPPERRSRPRRLIITAAAFVFGALVMATWIAGRAMRRAAAR